MKFFHVLMFCLFNSIAFAQSRSEQIERLLYRVDSLTITHSIAMDNCAKTQKELEEKLKSRNIDILSYKDSLRIINNQRLELFDLNERKRSELIKLKQDFAKQLDSLTSIIATQTVKWNIDTVTSATKNTDCFKFNEVPHCVVKSAPINQDMLMSINGNLAKLKYKIPSVLNGQVMDVTSDCSEWNENLCDRPWSVYNNIDYVNTKKYFSILQSSQLEFCGATWAFRGYTSFNYDLSKGQEINVDVAIAYRDVMRSDLKKYLSSMKIKEPIHETIDGMKTIDYEEIEDEIMDFEISDLTFYFKEDVLTLAFYKYEDSWTNRLYEIPLPNLQRSLNL